MGKTEFLRNDIMPMAENAGYRVFYFSFLDGSSGEIVEKFTQALQQFTADSLLDKSVSKAKSIKKIAIAGTSIEMNEPAKESISTILNQLASNEHPILLLLDEIQELVNIPSAAGVISSLRTGLDLNRTKTKTIFTGSSRNGLLSMFDDARAPFFHFSTNIDFPVLDDGFVLHLADIYTQITHDGLDVNALISTFDQLGRVPMHMRSLMKEVILDPNHSLSVALERIRSSIVDNQGYATTWMQLKGLDKSIIQYLAGGGIEPYSSNARQSYANGLGIKDVSVAAVQNAIRRLTRQNHLTKNAHGDYVVSEPNFLMWAKEQ
ncbi:hypothetical protein DTO96_100674 [Ephemeroptericola cinctiostellae]|uniref:ATPase domain-containing protein n=2 Tax=Ephemeroptericola cinctiostellae TaxID=2268024 RepID=A0A345D9C0_9BURK|nr:hypothetical protein DTO96_100674 [Ephemeroptericola cinctiostellae]